MKLISVNVGQMTPLPGVKATGQTGIFKTPAGGPVAITAYGLEGDAIADTRHHGGADQAVYVYGAPDYAWWEAELGQPLAPGTFGENLTVDGLESAGLSVGDRLHLAEVVLEVTAPRIPCATLAARMGDPTFVKRFRAAERPGVYCRVIREGLAAAGEAVRLEPRSGPTITVLEMFRDHYDKDWDEAKLRRHLAAPIASRAREDVAERLARLMGG
ncbi:MAG: MOSC domain-containing protein [Candidatus Promineofilum sp.]|nr:MOSC domain-containing protein [Promineifilum sp.]